MTPPKYGPNHFTLSIYTKTREGPMPDQITIVQPNRHRCRHIFVDGRRCRSASLRHEDFCYYHHTTRHPIADPAARKARLSTLDLTIPEDRASIQLSIGLILQRIASNDL